MSAFSRAFRVLPAAAYVVAIFVLGSLPSPPPGPVRVSDKLLHLVGFALLWPLLQLALSTLAGERSRRFRGLASLGIASGIGAALELWQALLPHRSSELLDWVADTVGAVIALALSAPLGWLVRKLGATA